MNIFALFAGLFAYVIVAVCLFSALNESLSDSEQIGKICIGILCVLVAGCVIALMTFTVTIRRLHDRGHTGWLILVYWLRGCVPFVNIVSGLIYLIDVGCVDGVPGPNQYGSDPKGRKMALSGESLTVNVSAVQNGGGPEARLRTLAKLKEEHILTEEEYQQKRRKVISEI